MQAEKREKMFHIALSKQDLEGAQYAIIPGDPKRVEKIAAYLEKPRKLAENREYTSFLGYVNGETPVVVCSTGIGGPSAAICIEELAMLGVKTFIRVGTCGGMNQKVCPGDLVVVTGAIRAEGTSREYLPVEYPAVSDFEVTTALVQAAKNMDMPFHTGVVQCKDSFYGQHSPERMPVADKLLSNWQAWLRGGCLASEMESAALFCVGAALGVKTGAVMHTIWNQEREKLGIKEKEDHNTENAIKAAVEAVKILAHNNINQ